MSCSRKRNSPAHWRVIARRSISPRRSPRIFRIIPNWQSDLSFMHQNLGDVHRAQNDLPAAVADYREGLVPLRPLLGATACESHLVRRALSPAVAPRGAADGAARSRWRACLSRRKLSAAAEKACQTRNRMRRTIARSRRSRTRLGRSCSSRAPNRTRHLPHHREAVRLTSEIAAKMKRQRGRSRGNGLLPRCSRQDTGRDIADGGSTRETESGARDLAGTAQEHATKQGTNGGIGRNGEGAVQFAKISRDRDPPLLARGSNRAETFL